MRELATCQEEALETYLETGSIPKKQIRDMITDRLVFPCYFGSALKMQGIEHFWMDLQSGRNRYSIRRSFPRKYIRFHRMSRGNRLTHLKVTGGTLKVKKIFSVQRRKGKMRLWKK